MRNDTAAVVEALRRGERPDWATTMASSPFDELVAFHQERGSLRSSEELEVQRERAGVAEEVALRTRAPVPFVEAAPLSEGSSVLFGEPAVLVHRGWAAVPIRHGSKGRDRHPVGGQGASGPCHPDQWRAALRRVEESAWLHAQAAGVKALDQR